MSIRRVGCAVGFVGVVALDLLALDDVTTAGARMPELLFLYASMPALVTLGALVLGPRPTSG